MSNETMDVVTTELVAPEPAGLQAIDRQEIDIQIATAKRYPRVISKCLDQARDMLTMDTDTAESAFYELPAFKGSKETIVGPSIRCAEIIAAAWGNIEFGSYPLEVTDTEVRACGFCRDREKNVSFKTVKSRPIKDKWGKTYPAHLITKTMLAAQAIAERDAICKVIPRAYINNLYKEAMRVADGKGETLENRVAKCMAFLKERGISEKQVLEHLEVEDKRDITSQQLGYLRGVMTAVKEGTTTIGEVFGTDKPTVDIKQPNATTADDVRTKAIERIAQLLADMPAQEIRDEAIARAKKKCMASKADWREWTNESLATFITLLEGGE